MNSEFLPNDDYPIDDIVIKTPKALQGGTYSASIELNSQPIVVQTPRCKTKKGIHKTSKQVYCDLLFLKDNTENMVFINWLNALQEKVRNLILENGEDWFHDTPSLDEIEYNWNDSIRTYKGNYNLIRTFIYKNKSLNRLNIQIYDDNENELNLENIDENKTVISILEVKGLKFSSQSFHLEIYLRQVMILNEKPLFSKCLIKTNNKEKKETKETLENLDDNSDKDTKKNPEKDTESNEIHEDIISDTNEESSNVTKDLDINVNENENNENNIILPEKQKVDNTLENNEESEASEITNNLDQTKIEENKTEIEQNNLDESDNEKQDNLEEKEVMVDETNESETLEKTQNNDENLEFDLQEINIDVSNSETIKLKNANDVYLDIYRKARDKAKAARNEAIKAYLEVKRIKELYMLDVIDSSDDEIEEYQDE